MMYLQEWETDIGAEDDLSTFSQAMNEGKSILWYNAMKVEINSMANNEVWDLIELSKGSKALVVSGFSRPN